MAGVSGWVNKSCNFDPTECGSFPTSYQYSAVIVTINSEVSFEPAFNVTSGDTTGENGILKPGDTLDCDPVYTRFYIKKRKVNFSPRLLCTLCTLQYTVILADTRQMAFVRPGEQELTQSSVRPPSIPLFFLNVSHINRFCCCLKWAQN